MPPAFVLFHITILQTWDEPVVMVWSLDAEGRIRLLALKPFSELEDE